MLTWTLRPISEFDNYSDQWDHLNGQSLPWLSSASVKVLLKHFGGRQKLAIARDRGLLAMTIIERKGWGWQTWQPSQCPTAIWVQPIEADFTWLAHLLRERLGTCVLGVTQLDPDIYPAPPGWMDYIETASISVRLGSTFEEYWAERGKNLRQDLPHQLRKLERAETPGKLVVTSDPEAVDQYGEIESAGWKGGTALSPTNAQGKFYKEWLPAIGGFAALYYFGSRLVACDLCVVQDCVLTILKTTHNEGVKGYSPASLLRYELFRQMWGELHRIEFYGRVSWHRKWTDEIRTMYHLNVYRWDVVFVKAAWDCVRRPRETVQGIRQVLRV